MVRLVIGIRQGFPVLRGDDSIRPPIQNSDMFLLGVALHLVATFQELILDWWDGFKDHGEFCALLNLQGRKQVETPLVDLDWNFSLSDVIVPRRGDEILGVDVLIIDALNRRDNDVLPVLEAVVAVEPEYEWMCKFGWSTLDLVYMTARPE